MSSSSGPATTASWPPITSLVVDCRWSFSKLEIRWVAALPPNRSVARASTSATAITSRSGPPASSTNSAWVNTVCAISTSNPRSSTFRGTTVRPGRSSTRSTKRLMHCASPIRTKLTTTVDMPPRQFPWLDSCSRPPPPGLADALSCRRCSPNADVVWPTF